MDEHKEFTYATLITKPMNAAPVKLSKGTIEGIFGLCTVDREASVKCKPLLRSGMLQ
jgi:hypothetical protein